MVIISFSSYPTEVAPQVLERFNALPAVPDNMKMLGPYTHFSGIDGIRAVAIYEFEESKMTEAFWVITIRGSSIL